MAADCCHSLSAWGGPCCVGLGLTLLTLGLAKKVLIADTLAGGVDAIYAGQYALDTVTALAAAFGYGTQLYFDFSGYADMAVGLGLLFGLRLPQNFRRPYTAQSLTEFWRRWHITLSSFLRDYLIHQPRGKPARYYPARRESFRDHGAWGVVAWGGVTVCAVGMAHGALLAIEHGLRGVLPGLARAIPQVIKMGLTISIVMLLWLPFRATDLDHTSALLAGLFNWSPLSMPTLEQFLAPLSLMSTAPSAPTTVLLWALMCGLRGVPTDGLALGDISLAFTPRHGLRKLARTGVKNAR